MDSLLQCAPAVMMIRPAAFQYNPQTADSNRMQQAGAGSDAARQAVVEFDHGVALLRGAGVRVEVVQDIPTPPRPDAVFPNNWVSWHADGTVVLYPMQAENRRLERRREILDPVAAALGYRIRRVVDLSPHEQQGRYLEGTGSLVLDHVGRRAFACRSPRTDEGLVRQWAQTFGYLPVLFDAADAGGTAWYHTNVMLSIGARAALVAADSIAAADRSRVLEELAATPRDVIAIDTAAAGAFAGNALELRAPGAGPEATVYALSTTAWAALPAGARARLQAASGAVLPLPVPTIERLGGGSVRCMLAEVFTA